MCRKDNCINTANPKQEGKNFMQLNWWQILKLMGRGDEEAIQILGYVKKNLN